MVAVTKQASKFKVDVNNVEPLLPVTKESLLLPTLTLDKRPWTSLGSSKDPTPYQINLSKELPYEVLEETSHNTVVLTTQLPCGTAAIIHPMEDTLIPSSLVKLSRYSAIATTVNSKLLIYSLC